MPASLAGLVKAGVWPAVNQIFARGGLSFIFVGKKRALLTIGNVLDV